MTVALEAAASTSIQHIALASISTHAACQARVKIRPSVVRDYRRAMAKQISDAGLRFPPIVLFTDGQHYWFADGFHRILAARDAGLTEFPADAEWSHWSDSEIARHCQVSQGFVTKMRRTLSYNGDGMRPRMVKRGDTVYEMRIPSNNTQTPAPEPEVDTPAEAPSPPATDRVGIPLHSDTSAAFAALSDFATIEKLHAQLAELVDQVARSPGGLALHEYLVRSLKDCKQTYCLPELNSFLRKLHLAMPHCGCCPRCHAKHPGRASSTCLLCRGRGWLTQSEYERCPTDERNQLLRLRT